MKEKTKRNNQLNCKFLESIIFVRNIQFKNKIKNINL